MDHDDLTVAVHQLEARLRRLERQMMVGRVAALAHAVWGYWGDTISSAMINFF
ncbi:hypothetical protein ACGFJC_47750 [Nonomuraea fuscirosea]|uniref:hypothetical protein n=1 Tax=Nonomuraea fuscirosea TaxID=1291556 RepID=UPI0037140959